MFPKKRDSDPKTSMEERNDLIKEHPAYLGNIICRCEMITEGEIIDAINPREQNH